MTTRVVILAAGKGTRMRSRLPKILHPLGGKPMVQHALDAARQASPLPPVLVIGHGAAAIRAAIGDQAEYVEQHEQNGTGHAVMQAQAALEGKTEQVIVSNADLPLLTGQTLAALAEAHAKSKAAITLLTLKQKNARGFGRIKRLKGKPVAIIEEAEATPKQLLIEELNVGAYCFNAKWLWSALSKLQPSANKGELYLTDLLAIAVKQNKKIHSLELQDPTEAIGINTREHLAEAEFALRQRINRHWMLAGVTIQDPLTTYIEPGVTLGQDTTILPNTMLLAGTQVGEDCIIGPNTTISHSRVGNGCHIQAAVVEHAVIENDVEIGPFAHLRTGAHLEDGVHMGNFGEIKNSRLAPGVKMGHFSYIGDATIGKNVNIGAGTITANYDGQNKNPTVIEDGVFIGSDTMLVAPLRIGKGARTGAGAVVTKDVPPHTVVAGVPARAIRKLEGSD